MYSRGEGLASCENLRASYYEAGTGTSMLKFLSTTVLMAGVGLISLCISARGADKAPCAAFQKLPNGNWNVVKAVKIENGKASVMLKPGTSIAPGMLVTNVGIYAALQKSCQGN
jgi:hypothetical protein